MRLAWRCALSLMMIASTMGIRVLAINYGTFSNSAACQEYAWGYCMGWCNTSEQLCDLNGVTWNWTSGSTVCTGNFSCLS